MADACSEKRYSCMIIHKVQLPIFWHLLGRIFSDCSYVGLYCNASVDQQTPPSLGGESSPSAGAFFIYSYGTAGWGNFDAFFS